MKRLIIILSLLSLLWTIPAEAQCAMCRAVLESEETKSVAVGVNNGIKYLMVIPYILMGALGYIIYRSRKKEANSKN